MLTTLCSGLNVCLPKIRMSKRYPPAGWHQEVELWGGHSVMRVGPHDWY